MNETNLTQAPARPPSLVRAGAYLLIPILVTLALPFIFLLALILYLLALIHGARIFVFRWGAAKEAPEFEIPKPHFLDIEIPAKVVSEETTPPAKG